MNHILFSPSKIIGLLLIIFSSHLQANYVYTANLSCAPTSARITQEGSISVSNNAQCNGSSVTNSTVSRSGQYKIDATGGYLSAGGSTFIDVTNQQGQPKTSRVFIDNLVIRDTLQFNNTSEINITFSLAKSAELNNSYFEGNNLTTGESLFRLLVNGNTAESRGTFKHSNYSGASEKILDNVDETGDFTVTIAPHASLTIGAHYGLFLRSGSQGFGNDKDFSTGSVSYQWYIALPEGVDFSSELGANYQSLVTVPLPAAWGLMIAGFSVLGVMRKRTHS